MTVIGTRDIKNNGVDIETMTIDRITMNRQRMSDLYDSGIEPSTASISLLKRFIIRPIGVDSKKPIVLRNIDDSMAVCSADDALMNIMLNIQSAKNTNTAIKIINVLEPKCERYNDRVLD